MTGFAALAAGATIASGLPVIAGAAARRSESTGIRLLWWWLATGFIMNLIMASLALRGMRTVTFALGALPVLAWLGIATMSELTQRRWVTRVNLAAVIGFSVWWGMCVIRQEYRTDFTAYSAPVLSVILTLASVFLILTRLTRRSSEPLRDFGVLTGVAVLVTYAPMAAIEPLSSMLFEGNRELVRALWGARAMLLICGSLLFAYAMRRVVSQVH